LSSGRHPAVPIFWIATEYHDLDEFITQLGSTTETRSFLNLLWGGKRTLWVTIHSAHDEPARARKPGIASEAKAAICLPNT